VSVRVVGFRLPQPVARASGIYNLPVRKVTTLLAVLACGAVLRLPTFARPLLSDDEAIYATTAAAMRQGELLYRDVVDHKPPLIYHVYQAGFALFGDFETHGAHLFVILAVLATAILLWRLGGRGPLGPRAGLVAALLWLVFSTTWHDYDALAANCELFLLVPQTLAALVVLVTFDQPAGPLRLLLHLVAGTLIGVAALFKYQALTFLAVSLGMLLYGAAVSRDSRRSAILAAGLQLGGALLPALGYLAAAAVLGNARDTLTWFRFNFSYLDAGLTGWSALGRGARRLFLIGGVALVPYALGIAGAIATARALVRQVRPPRSRSRSPRHAPEPRDVMALLWLLSSALAVCAGGRFFGHYFHLILPPLCLLGAAGFLRLWDQSRTIRRWLIGLCAAPALVFLLLATVARPLAEKLDHADPPYQPVAARLAALSPSNARIFVWGNSPQLYVLARRQMGTRFSFCNYMTGESPGTPTETGERDAGANVLQASWDMLFADLELRRPLLFVDAAAAKWDGYEKFPVDRYPELARYRAEHYRPVEAEQGVIIYVRR
jgi:hypothetical protein